MSTHELYETDDVRAKTARRVSAALGRKVDVSQIDWNQSIAGHLTLKDGAGHIFLLGDRGNVAYLSAEHIWVRDGRRLSDAEADRACAANAARA